MKKLKFIFDRGRGRETIITRFRLGKNTLNHYLHTIKRHPTGLCECGLLEDIQHYIFKCEFNIDLKNALMRICDDRGIEFTLVAVLNDADCLQELSAFVLGSKRGWI